MINSDSLPRFVGTELYKTHGVRFFREAVGAILSGLNLGHWQDSMMKQSLNDLQHHFRVEPRQPGYFFFFSRPQGPRRPQHVTSEQRQIAAEHAI